jgi:hypothetical protein
MKILEELDIVPTKINGEPCISLMDFAKATNKSPSHISNLILKGNSQRQMRCVRMGKMPYIPVKEITEFPFTTVGRNCKVYYYLASGKTTEVEETK